MNDAGFYQRQGNFDRMIEAVEERVRKQEPNNPRPFYTLATFYWEKASRDVKLSDAQKATYANAGLDAVNKALDLKSDYFEALTYKNLLLRTKANISKDPKEQQQFLKEADELRKQAEELRNKQRAATALRRSSARGRRSSRRRDMMTIHRPPDLPVWRTCVFVSHLSVARRPRTCPKASARQRGRHQTGQRGGTPPRN
jgi:hypothetical protein